MRKLLLGALLLLSTLSFSQTIDGITLGKPFTQVVSILTSKGFKPTEPSSPTIKSYLGRLSNGDDVKIMIVITPKSKLVWKLIISKDVYSWRQAKSTFDTYKEKLVNKYGPTTKDYTFFSEPYYDGDGYELQAIEMDKCTWFSYWETPNITIQIKSFKYNAASIWISYENNEASEVNTKEKAVLDGKTF
jgi:hypothetical protein